MILAHRHDLAREIITRSRGSACDGDTRLCSRVGVWLACPSLCSLISRVRKCDNLSPPPSCKPSLAPLSSLEQLHRPRPEAPQQIMQAGWRSRKTARARSDVER